MRKCNIIRYRTPINSLDKKTSYPIRAGTDIDLAHSIVLNNIRTREMIAKKNNVEAREHIYKAYSHSLEEAQDMYFDSSGYPITKAEFIALKLIMGIGTDEDEI